MSNIKNSSKFLEMSSEDLVSKLNSLKKELFNFRFQASFGDLKNTSVFKKIKKDLARINTEISNRKNGVK